jgi:flagellar protein FlaG
MLAPRASPKFEVIDMVNEISSRSFVPQVNVPVGNVVETHNARQSEKVGVRQEPAVSGKDAPPSTPLRPPVDNPDVSEVNSFSESAMVEAMKRMKDFIQTVDRDLLFEIDKESGRTIITVIDAKTDEIVRQIPPEEVLSVMRALEHGRGLLEGIKV